jgi:hypothetical protein
MLVPGSTASTEQVVRKLEPQWVLLTAHICGRLPHSATICVVPLQVVYSGPYRLHYCATSLKNHGENTFQINLACVQMQCTQVSRLIHRLFEDVSTANIT